jgi:ArsR family transcriptional regulator, arsenate/arsenite/antimonite-responsive transcriptional repressor
MIVEIGFDSATRPAQPVSMNIETAAPQLEALGNRTRLTLYRTLVRAGEDGLPVGRLQLKLEIPPSTLSHHLRKLVDVGLVSQERQATTLICRANYSAMTGLIGYLADECCADAALTTPSRA